MYILWKRCNKQGISEFFESFFGHCDIDLGNVKDDVWTPAEVAQICISHRDDFKLASKKICERKRKVTLAQKKEDITATNPED